MITTTLNRIRDHGPCANGWTRLLKGLGKTESDDEPLPFARIVEINGLDDALWCCRAEPQEWKTWRLFAVWCARQVQHLATDPRSIDALDVVERHANGNATDEELAAARDASGDARDATWAAWYAARNAWYAARNATWDARDAAWDAWYAARDAWYASDATRIAWAAAWDKDAARAALDAWYAWYAWYAARAAWYASDATGIAWAAAWDKDAAKAKFIEMVNT
jgi:hypothetical protein